MLALQGHVNAPKPTIEEMRKMLPLNKPTLDDDNAPPTEEDDLSLDSELAAFRKN